LRHEPWRHSRGSFVVIRLHDITDSIEDLRQCWFDSAVSVNVFEHIDDDAKAMAAVHALL